MIEDLPNVFRTILKKYNLAPGDFPDINKFQQKLNEVKFADFQPLSQTMVDGLDKCLNVEFPRLMDQLPSEKDAPDVLRKKGAMTAQDPGMVPVPSTNLKFGKAATGQANPFGYSETDEEYWALQESADRLLPSFEALGPQGGFLPTNVAREVLVNTGLDKEQLRQIWNLSDIDKDGYLDLEEYVIAMFLCDAVIQKGRPIPAELPTSVVPPRKREILASYKRAGLM